MANEIIREAARQRGIRLWQIALRLHLNDGNFSRKLRVELPEEERDKILTIIEEISAENALQKEA